jgi:mannitol/fructose-specific phosphotransferase system IIA component (Ntr-type)
MSAFGIDIDKRAVRVFGRGVSKEEALESMVDSMYDAEVVDDREAFRKAIHEREAVMSTGIGSGVAIPHVRINQVKRPAVGIGVSREGIDFDTLDDAPYTSSSSSPCPAAPSANTWACSRRSCSR